MMANSTQTKVDPIQGSTRISKLWAPKVDMSHPAGEQIFQTLKLAILRMDLPPGCVLSETEIGVQLGSSRTPVREAFMRLREAGLVTTFPSRGNFVTKLNRNKILEAQFLREALETANIRRLVEIGLSDNYRNALSKILIEQKVVMEQGDGVQFHLFDDKFHLTLATATGFPHAAIVLEREKMLLDRLRALSLRDESHQRELLSEHQQIFDAICEKDMVRAVSTTRQHLRSILVILSDVVERNAEYFD